MERIPIYTVVLLTLLLSSCQRPSGSTAHISNGDSIYHSDYIYSICITEPERALALADTAETMNLLSPDHITIDALKGLIYNNGMEQSKLAMFYCQKAYEDSSFRKNTEGFLNNLSILTSLYYKSNDYASAIRFASEGLEIARAHGVKNMEADFLLHIGMSQGYLGLAEESKANLNRSIKIFETIAEKENTWSSTKNLIYTLGETMDALCSMGNYQQASTLISHILNANARFQQTKDKAPNGLLDMYKAFVNAQCMEVYIHLKDMPKAKACYRVCASTDFSKTPRGISLLNSYLIQTKEYNQALKNIHIAKDYYRADKDTINEYYVSGLLKEESEALIGLNQYKEAQAVNQQMIALKDSINIRNQRDDAQELAVIYESGEKDKQIQQEKTVRNMLLIFIIGVMWILVAVVHYSRKIRHRNLYLVRSLQSNVACKDELLKKDEENLALMKQLDALRKELDSLSNAKEEINFADSPISDEREQLKLVLHEISVRKLYLQSGITNKSYQDELNLPSAILGPHFKDLTGHNFSEYINKLRMDHAVKLLTQYPEYTIDAISKMCGIDSRQHFHRLFSEHLGITPSAFRKSHLTKKTNEHFDN